MAVIINGTTGVTSVNGSAAAPSVTGTDTDTGIVYGTNTLSLATGGTTAMTIDSSQNMGLNVVPSAWKSNYKAQQTGNAAAIVGRTDNNNNYFSSNWYVNSSNQDIYQNTGYATIYSQGTGTHAWYTAASGTAGNTISFTQAMTLDASGNLGLGATTVNSMLHMRRDTASGSSTAYPNIRLDNPNASGYTGLYFFADGTQKAGLEVSNAAGALQFFTGTTERARIDSSGRFMVGQTSSSYTFSVTGTAYLESRLSTGYGASSGATLGCFGASNDTAVNNAAVYNMEWTISGGANGQFWYSNYITRGGSRTLGAYCTGTTWTNASDIANKENITPIKYGLDTVMASNPVDFDWKSMRDENGKGKADVGFIAQEMELLVPEVVTGEEGQKGISYGNLVAVAFKAIQEQQAIIETLKARLDAANL